MSNWTDCRYCGRTFPEAAITARPMHETYRCPMRPDDAQQRLTEVTAGE